MRIAIRVDASLEIGTGHVMRCLTLADALQRRGDDCVFICRPYTGNLLALIAQRGFDSITLPILDLDINSPKKGTSLVIDWQCDAREVIRILGIDSFDWLIVDHYSLGFHWEKQMRSSARKIMVIDDLANRIHDCDLLLDQNLGAAAQKYIHLIPRHADTLIGPGYALLRPEFMRLRAESLSRRNDVRFKHIMISMGGIDVENFTGSILKTIQKSRLQYDVRITVVLGSESPWIESVRQLAGSMSQDTRVLINVNNIESLMLDSDLAIGAAGATAWERCCLGLPTLIFLIAENQKEAACALESFGAAFLMGSMDELESFINYNLTELQDYSFLQKLSRASACVTDGAGTQKVLDYLN